MCMYAGAAWRSILEALGVAAGDHSAQVVSGALVALQQVIDLLFQVGPLLVSVALPSCCVQTMLECNHLTVLISPLPSATPVSLCRDSRYISTVASAALMCPVVIHVVLLQDS